MTTNTKPNHHTDREKQLHQLVRRGNQIVYHSEGATTSQHWSNLQGLLTHADLALEIIEQGGFDIWLAEFIDKAEEHLRCWEPSGD